MFINRRRQTFRHRSSNAVVLVVNSRQLSFGTGRHTLVVIDPGQSRHKVSSTVEADERQNDWEYFWEQI